MSGSSITEGPAIVMRPSFYTGVGLDPWRADIVVVKNFFPFLMFFLPYNRKTIFVRTHGATDFDAAFALCVRRADPPARSRRRLARRAIAIAGSAPSPARVCRRCPRRRRTSCRDHDGLRSVHVEPS